MPQVWSAGCTPTRHHRPPAEEFLAADQGEQDEQDEALEWYGDSAYGTGDPRGAINDADGEAVIKPKPRPAAIEGGFTVDDFIVDEQEGTVTCPAGNTRPASPTRVASFGAMCRSCPLRQRCTKSKTGRKIALPERDDLLRQARRERREEPELREKYRKFRPNLERVISQLASRGGLRLKLRCRGTTKNNAWLSPSGGALLPRPVGDGFVPFQA